MKYLPLYLIAVPLLSLSAKAARPPAIPAMRVPLPLGVNIHFTSPRPGEMEMLVQGGFHWIRMDFSWGATEKRAGVYDFSAYDGLLAALKPHSIRAIFILDYSNRLYDQGLSPHTPAGRQAFARWAAAAAVHFRDQGILWEMYNEPNGGFWKPKADVNQYIQLALAVGAALHKAAPHETYIGPATSTVDFPYLEACFKAGLLRYWTAVSIHPYRQEGPETAGPEFRRLRQMILHYAPTGKSIPIISGEWGYSSAWAGENDDKQGRMLPRQWLFNLLNNIAISIWYDWHEDGTSPTDPEAHFGTVRYPYRAGQNPVYEPKPAYLAAQTLTRFLDGCQLRQRLALPNPNDYVLLFGKDGDTRLAAWTSAPAPHTVTIPASTGLFHAIGHTGAPLPDVSATAAGLTLTLTDAPMYLKPDRPNDVLRLAAAWERLPLEIPVKGPAVVVVRAMLRNPLPHDVELTSNGRAYRLHRGGLIELSSVVKVNRSAEPIPVTLEWRVGNDPAVSQQTSVVVRNPLSIAVLPVQLTNGGEAILPVRIENPSGAPFQGKMRLTSASGLQAPAPGPVPVNVIRGQTEATVRIPVQHPTGDYRVGIQLDTQNGVEALHTRTLRFRALDTFQTATVGEPPPGYVLRADGDAAVPSEGKLTTAADGPAPGMKSVQLDYSMKPGWKFFRLVPPEALRSPLEGKPAAVGIWVRGDGSGMQERLRFTDTTGQTFQPDAPDINWKGWKYVQFPLDGIVGGHWGGSNDGVIHYPIHLDTLFLLDNGQRREARGSVAIAAPVMIW